MKIVIIGNGIAGNMCALYLSKILPSDAQIILIGPRTRGGLPLVGESTVEITARFLEEQLGLKEYLKSKHYPKYGLSYYFKEKIDAPNDRNYSLHINTARPPAWQLNREIFDRDLQNFVDELGRVKRIVGLVKDIEISTENTKHVISYQEESAEFVKSLSADWVIDTSGRKQLIPKKLGLVVRPETQRNCFWFWVKDFDRNLLSNLNIKNSSEGNFNGKISDRDYYCTHHFMGKGNWIWLIPIKTEDGSDLISIGITSRPDIYPHKIKTMEEFNLHVANEHPVVTELVKSGNIVDECRLQNYHYVLSQAYSKDRWCVVGDAAFAPDPLFSNGLAFCTIQIEQVGEMIKRDLEGNHDPDFIHRLDRAFWGPVLGSQTAISSWYPTIHDSFLMPLRLIWIEINNFYMLLPMVANDCHYKDEGLDLWQILHFIPAEKNKFDLPQTIMDLREKYKEIPDSVFDSKSKLRPNEHALTRVDSIKEIQVTISEGRKMLMAFLDDVIRQVEKNSL